MADLLGGYLPEWVRVLIDAEGACICLVIWVDSVFHWLDLLLSNLFSCQCWYHGWKPMISSSGVILTVTVHSCMLHLVS